MVGLPGHNPIICWEASVDTDIISYLIQSTHEVLITIQNSVDKLNKFTMYFQNWLHK